MRPLFHPAREDITVEGILHALSDPVRAQIYAEIAKADCPQICTAFLEMNDRVVPKSTLSQHFKVLREAGLIDIHVNPLVHVYPPGHGRRNLLLDFSENLSERLVAEGLASESELTGLKADLSRHLADPNTLVVSHLYFQAWGRKPG